MTRAGRIAIVVAGLAALQLGLLLVYRAVQESRRAGSPAPPFAVERLGGAEVAPAFDATRVDGERVVVAWPTDAVRIVHFWATWCEPCRVELPGLLALARELRGQGIELVAVAVDDDWADIRGFFAGDVPPEVVIAGDAAIHERMGVSTLPDTYLVDPRGRVRERLHGARDWTSDPARRHLRSFR